MPAYGVASPRTLFVTGNTNTSGDQTLIASPGAGLEIVITWIFIQNASSTATTAILKTTTTNFVRFLGQNQGDMFAQNINGAFRLGNSNALLLNLSGANAHNYSIGYYIDSATG